MSFGWRGRATRAQRKQNSTRHHTCAAVARAPSPHTPRSRTWYARARLNEASDRMLRRVGRWIVPLICATRRSVEAHTATARP